MSRSIARGLDVLELFAREARPLTLTEIARELSIAVSTCHDVLRTLRERGVLYEVTPRAGFYPTGALGELARAHARHDPVLPAAEAALGKVRDTINESVALAHADVRTHELRYLLVLEADHPLRYSMTVGRQVRSLHATSAGRAYLSLLAPDQRRGALGPGRLERLTPRTLVSRADVLDRVAAEEEQGYAVNDQESVDGATTVSVAFRRGGAAYVVTVAGPTGRVAPRLQAIASALSTAAAALTMPAG